jgi:hypothetical protein
MVGRSLPPHPVPLLRGEGEIVGHVSAKGNASNSAAPWYCRLRTKSAISDLQRRAHNSLAPGERDGVRAKGSYLLNPRPPSRKRTPKRQAPHPLLITPGFNHHRHLDPPRRSALEPVKKVRPSYEGRSYLGCWIEVPGVYFFFPGFTFAVVSSTVKRLSLFTFTQTLRYRVLPERSVQDSLIV